MKPASLPPAATAGRHWRRQAAVIIEELISGSPPAAWDALLDLRRAILGGEDWEAALDLFLACKADWEADNYLPFYRLRRLLAASLRLETSGFPGSPVDGISIAGVLRMRHRSLDAVRRAVARDRVMASFPGLPSHRGFPVRLHVQEVGSR